jgi:acetyl esterase/lipase
MTLHPQAAAYLRRVEELGIPPVERLTPAAARANAEAAAAAIFGPVEELPHVADVRLAGVPCRVYRPVAGEAELPVTVYLHGGGWVIGSLDTHDGIGRALARRAGCEVVSVGYRLAPEHRFPAAVDDAWAVVRELAASGRPVAVAGDSAGGNLAAVVALRARDQGLPIRLQVLVYPVTDYHLDTASYLANAEGFGLTRAAMAWYWEHYLGGQDGRHPDASPLRAADLGGVAPALVITCEHDPLRDEGQAYARRLREAGVAVRLVDYEGMIHGFFRMAAIVDLTQDALDEVASALAAALS